MNEYDLQAQRCIVMLYSMMLKKCYKKERDTKRTDCRCTGCHQESPRTGTETCLIGGTLCRITVKKVNSSVGRAFMPFLRWIAPEGAAGRGTLSLSRVGRRKQSSARTLTRARLKPTAYANARNMSRRAGGV